MPRFSANISTLFQDVPLVARFARARAAGFDTVEIQFPYEVDLSEAVAAKNAAGVAVDLINAPPGDRAAGERGLAGLPGREDDFAATLAPALRYAEALGARKIYVLVGVWPKGADPARCRDTLRANLARAAAAFAPAGIKALHEPLNAFDNPGYMVNTTADALAHVRAAGHRNLYVQADLYHMARMGEEHGPALLALGDRLGHVQFADAPGRGEPGTGTLDFSGLFAAVAAAGYRDFIGAEYTPTKRTEETMGWLTGGKALLQG